jgi:hypothetical protein
MSDTESTSSSNSSNSRGSLTVGKLLKFLNKLVAKDPEAKKMTIHFEEFGSLQDASYITVENELNGERVKPYLVIE